MVDKKQKLPKKGGTKAKEDLPHSYENTLICEEAKPSLDAERKERRKSPLNFLTKKRKPNNAHRLTHTYMETPAIPEGNGDICDSAAALGPLNADNDYCYTEVDMGGATTTNAVETKEEEYEAVGTMKGPTDTYDHLDRDAKTGQGLDKSPEVDKNDKEEEIGKYGVLLQCSSVEKEDYDIFLRSVSQTEQPGNNGYGSLQQTNEEAPLISGASHNVSGNIYDDLDRGLTFTSRHKEKDLLGHLYQTPNGESYGIVGSGLEGKPNGDSRPSSSADVESVYTDMSGGTSEGARPNISLDEMTYTEMSPVRSISNYYNVSVDVEDPRQEESVDGQYSSLLDSKQEAYDHVERKLDGGKRVNPKGDPKNQVATNKGQENIGFIYENM